jgi:ribonuclease HII
MTLDNIIKYELPLWKNGVDYIAGVDEVGRGSLAGPMVVSAVIINKEHLLDLEGLDLDKFPYHEIKDSKLLTAKKRDYLSDFLHNELISYSIYEIAHDKIDGLGIMACTQIAFSQAIKNLKIKPQHVFTDNYEIKKLAKQSQTNLVRGDQKSITVAAASIVAKVYRDNLMVDLHYQSDKYKVYQFHKHKGYGTKLHREMIKKHGYSDVHRRSFHLK